MAPEAGILASFADPVSAAAAIREARAAGHPVRVASPAPFPEVVAALGKPASRLGWVTFTGAVLGLICGVGLTAGTSAAWPLVTGGKPILSWPTFVIVIFEVTVLVGSLVNLVALLVAARRGGRRAAFPPGRQFNADRIGVFVPGGGPEAERIFRERGAEEVSRVA